VIGKRKAVGGEEKKSKLGTSMELICTYKNLDGGLR
jgi:hypothetical protein